MKVCIYIVVSIMFVGVTVVWVATLPFVTSQAPATNWLAIASILVSVATLASIAFAVILYTEGHFLRRLVEESGKRARKQHKKAMDDIETQRDASYEISLTCIKGLMRSFMHLPEDDIIKRIIAELCLSEIKIHLARETPESLVRAMKVSYQYHQDVFLDMQATMWEKSEVLEPVKRKLIRNLYLRLKKMIDSQKFHRGGK